MQDMRIDRAVIRGEINNTRRELVELKLWLKDLPQPVNISLSGNCLKDIAGCHLTFTNNLPESEQRTVSLPNRIEGIAGEITASSRLSVHKTDGMGGFKQPELVNIVRIEFFTEKVRYIFESFTTELQLKTMSWSMEEDAHFGQSVENFFTWKTHLESRVNELKSARSLQDLQYLTNLYDEFNHRYADDLDCDHKEAMLMGWTGIVQALAEDVENKLDVDVSFAEELEDDEYSLSPFSEEEWDDEAETHPLLRMIAEIIDELELSCSNFLIPAGRTCQNLVTILEEIEDGLSCILKSEKTDQVTAQKGIREYIGKMTLAFGILSEVLDLTETKEGRRELLYLRDSMLDLREGISALRFEIKKF